MQVGLWKQLQEPATTKDWFLVCLCMTLGFGIGCAYGFAAAMLALAK